MKGLKRIKNRKNSGLTLLETMLAIAISSFVLINIIGFIGEQTYQERMRISAQNVTTINSAYMRRVMHDGLDFNKFSETKSELDFVGNENIGDFLNLLTPVGACNNSGSWEPVGTEEGDLLRNVPLISCNLSDFLGSTFGLDFSAVMVKDNSPEARGIIGFKIIIDYSDSELFNSSSTNIGWGVSGSARVVQYMDMIESRLPSDLIGTQRVYLSTIGSITDFSSNSYEERDVNDCFLGGTEDCSIVVEINFSGGFNQQYLRTDGGNSMLASIKFALSGADSESEDYQKCVIWNQDEFGEWNLNLSDPNNVVNCGLLGGEGHEYDFNRLSGTQSVTDAVQTEGLYIRLKEEDGDNIVPFNHFCSMFDDVSDTSGFVDEFGLGSDVPCGIYEVDRDGDRMVQVLTDVMVSELIEAETLSTFNLLSREVVIKRKDGEENVLTIIDPITEDEVYSVFYDTTSDVYNFTSVGNSEFLIGDSNEFRITIDNDVSLTFRSNGSGQIAARAENLLMEIDRLTLEGDTLDINYNEVNIDSDVNLLEDNDFFARGGAGIYSEYSTFISSVMDDSYDDEYKRMATYDSVLNLKHFQSRVILRFVNVVSGENSTIAKPDCLDVIPDDERDMYDDSPIDISGSGQDLARIVLVPITFRTYSGSFGGNQFYTHSAQSAGDNWNLYFYFTGDGIAGGGAREDDSGSSMAMIYCDYSSIF